MSAQDLIIAGDGLAAGSIIVVVCWLLEFVLDHVWRLRFPLFVAARCEVDDTSPPTVRIEGRLTGAVGKFLPKLASGANATLAASPFGFEFRTEGAAVPSTRIQRSDMTYAETGGTDARTILVLLLVLVAAFIYIWWAAWLPAEYLAIVLIAIALGGIVFDAQMAYLVIVRGSAKGKIALRMTTLHTLHRGIGFERAVEALFRNAHSGFDASRQNVPKHPDIRLVRRVSRTDESVSIER